MYKASLYGCETRSFATNGYVNLEIFATMIIKVVVLLVVTPCSFVGESRLIEKTCCLHVQG
jgi:hypothetical protein